MAERAPSSNVYTALALVALVTLITGVVYVWMRSTDLFNTGNPFEVVRTVGALRQLLPF